MSGDAGRGGAFAEHAGLLAGQAGVAFGWAPEAFWSATPAELMALVRAAMGETVVPPDRRTMAALMEAFPDG